MVTRHLSVHKHDPHTHGHYLPYSYSYPHATPCTVTNAYHTRPYTSHCTYTHCNMHTCVWFLFLCIRFIFLLCQLLIRCTLLLLPSRLVELGCHPGPGEAHDWCCIIQNSQMYRWFPFESPWVWTQRRLHLITTVLGELHTTDTLQATERRPTVTDVRCLQAWPQCHTWVVLYH